jgi:dephospho-CoA kinase
MIRSRPFVLGLTGSIGMGKSTAAAMLKRMGLPIWDADAAVHRLFRQGGAAVAAIEAAFPGTVKNGAVDRQALGARVFGDHAALRQLERIVHPLVWKADRRFRKLAAARRASIIVMDVPLLFEGGGYRRCDAVIVVSAPRLIQEQRVLKRPGMTREKLTGILNRQMADLDKRKKADFVVPSGLGRAVTYRHLSAIVRAIYSGRILRRDRRARYR